MAGADVRARPYVVAGRPAGRHADAPPPGRAGYRSVRVEALPGLAAEVAGPHHAQQALRRGELLVLGVVVDALRGVHHDVDAGQVERRERTHGMAEAEL